MTKAEKPAVTPDRAKAREKLEKLWNEVLDDETAETPENIRTLVNSKQVSIRFCLPTQLLGKLTDPTLDALCLQRGDGKSGKWDPRGFCSQVVALWNRDNQNVLGSSGDPYVNNPLRRPRVDAGMAQLSDRDQWDLLIQVLQKVQDANDPDVTEITFRQVLVAIKHRLNDLTFNYVVPARVSFEQSEKLVRDFLTEKSGGERGLAVTAALFEALREHMGLYSEVRRGMVNAADAATNAAGDLECFGQDGQIVLVVEVKERQIGDADVQIAIAKARGLSVRELLLCTHGIKAVEADAVRNTLANAWASGTNTYHATINELIRGIIPLLGESGTREFVVQTGKQLDKFNTQPKHRKAWKAFWKGCDAIHQHRMTSLSSVRREFVSFPSARAPQAGETEIRGLALQSG